MTERNEQIIIDPSTPTGENDVVAAFIDSKNFETPEEQIAFMDSGDYDNELQQFVENQNSNENESSSEEHGDSSSVEQETTEENILTRERLLGDGFDYSKLDKKQVEQALNHEAKSIRESYKEQIKTNEEKLVQLNNDYGQSQKDIKNLGELFQSLPNFLAEKMGIEPGSLPKNLKESLQHYAIEKLATAEGKTVSEYMVNQQEESFKLQQQESNLKASAQKAVEELKQDSIFSQIDVEGKEDKILEHIISNKVDLTKTSAKQIARNIYSDEWDEAKVQEGIKKALAGNKSQGQADKIQGNQVNKNQVKASYDPNKDAKFLAELKEINQ